MLEEKKYTKPEAELVIFDNEDIILTSDFDVEDEEIE